MIDQYPEFITMAIYQSCMQLAYYEMPDFCEDRRYKNRFVLSRMGRRVNKLLLDMAGCLDAELP
jgi:hypothetical protein